MKTIEVFGVSNDVVESYIEREAVDNLFQQGIDLKKHVIVFGSSKQGKTALLNRHLSEKSYVKVNCSPEMTPTDIYKSILRQLNIEFTIEQSNTSREAAKVGSEINAKVSIPFIAGGGAKFSGDLTADESKTSTKKFVDYNLSQPQDISEILKGISFSKRIILENFHYLSEEIQKQLAFHLRIFEDMNILFVILGIWREKNRLAQFNGDLQDRLIEIPVEPWEKDDFKRVIEKGAPLLNVNFDSVFEEITSISFDSIGVFQELCKETCLAAKVNETSEKLVYLSPIHLGEAKLKKLNDYSGRHTRSLETFINQKGRSSSDTPLYLAYYFVKFLFQQNFDAIVNGFTRKQIHEGIKSLHHRQENVRPSDMSNFLHNLVSNQVKKGIRPPLFDYDMSIRTLKIIDSTFYFFMRNANLTEVAESFDSPAGLD
jgi:hypothetical protein